MIDFQKIHLCQREQLHALLLATEKGCEYTFANLCIWGRQRAAQVDGYWVIFSQFDRKAVYPFPVGQGEVLPVLDAIIADARQRGIPCCLTGLNQENMDLLERYYPGKFRFQCDRSSFDYVYNIDDLADLKGRKFQKKRNHLNRFRTLYPNWRTEELNRTNLDAARAVAQQWYQKRQETDPMGSYQLEQIALERAFAYYEDLGMEGMLLLDGERPIAFAMASRLSKDTFDVHFEKALEDVDGAYPAINREFAAFLRDRHPELRYLDREEDMGLEGLRKAKLSYCPDHMIEKCWARLWEETDEN